MYSISHSNTVYLALTYCYKGAGEENLPNWPLMLFSNKGILQFNFGLKVSRFLPTEKRIFYTPDLILGRSTWPFAPLAHLLSLCR
jgi:hypothetical protein